MADDRAAEALAAIRDRICSGRIGIPESRTRLAIENAPRLLAVVEAALAGHRRSALPATSGEHRGKHYCLDCTPSIDGQTVYAVWPCTRYAAIERELTNWPLDPAEAGLPAGAPLTHYFHCWRFPSHHACAVALIERQQEDNDRLLVENARSRAGRPEVPAGD